LRQALFTFYVYINQCLDNSLFYLQYDVKSVLFFTAIINTSLTCVELAEASEYRQDYIQDLSKHCTKAANKYNAALEQLTKSKDDFYSKSPIIIRDLVM
jgi:hypothetical protein